MKLLLTLLLAADLVCAGCATTTNSTEAIVQHRGNVTYESPDWARSDLGKKVDVAPYPVGGMATFQSRLDYPPPLRMRRVTGTVRVGVSLGADGGVLRASIIQSVDPVLYGIVLRAVQKTKWVPAMRGGKAVPIKFKFPVTFGVTT